jgi:4,5-dihydroxyphthalate decarboxylase
MPSAPLRLKALIGDHAVTMALKQGKVTSPIVALDIAPVSDAYHEFKRVVRGLEFDVAEMAIVTYLMAKAHAKPYVLMPVVLLARFQHPFIIYNSARGELKPTDLNGKRIGIRSYSVTTPMWLRGVLMNEHGLDIDTVTWVTSEEAHVAEFRDPPNVQRAPEGSNLLSMLLEGQLDALVLANRGLPDPRLRHLIPDPDQAAADWHARHRAIQVNHLAVVRSELTKSNPDAVREIFRMLKESKQLAPPLAPGEIDLNPIGLGHIRRELEIAIDYIHQQRLIPRRYSVDEIFDDVTRALD